MSTTTKEVFSFLKSLIIFITIVIFLRASVVEAFKIPSGSMLPTLQIGDQIIVGKFSYGIRFPFMTHSIYQFATPSRGDIVVFTRDDEPQTEEDESSINIIKRVVGLPGDMLEVKNRDVYINNELYKEPYAIWLEGGLDSYGPYKIPEGKVLLLGDNRDHSKDSRFWAYPFLDITRIKGKAWFIYFNMHDLGRIGSIVR